MSERTEQVQDLGSLIQATPYQTFSNDPRQGTQADSESGVPQGGDNSPGVNQNEGLSPAATDVPGSPNGATGQDGVTTQTSPGLDGNQQFDPRVVQELQHQNQLLTQTIQNQTRFIQTDFQRRQQAEEAEFQRQLADMDEDERERAIERRELERLRAEREFRQGQDRQQEQMKQFQAKSLLSTQVAAEYGLPVQDAKQYLMRARNMNDMQAIAQDLVNKGYGRQVQQPQQQVQQQQVQQNVQQQNQQPFDNPAHLGGDVSASSDVTPEPKWGSGDLVSYIQQQPYQVMALED
jgi:hypothetical protein